MTDVSGLLVSQVGYDLGWPIHVVLRAPLSTPTQDRTGRLSGDADQPIHFGYWGQKWGSHWWVADLSGLAAGSYLVEVESFAPEKIRVAENTLWHQTWYLAAVDQLQRRRRLAQGHSGWYDAGTKWQEANSHTAMLNGLLDLLEISPDEVSSARSEILEQIENGLDYLATLQTMAAELGQPGAIVHQVFTWDKLILPADVSKAAVVWARAARLLGRSDYRERALAAMEWLRTAVPLGEAGFSRLANGIPETAEVPLEWPTRDLLMSLWAWVELDRTDEAVSLAREIMARQITPDQADRKLSGYFRNFASLPYPEKSWVHGFPGSMGADIGATYPHFVLPLLTLLQRNPEHEDAAAWAETVRRFAYGYFLPACSANPFHLLPIGEYEGQGLLDFVGLWHGMNAAYALAAVLAIEFERLYGDAGFRQITAGNLQWIAGLNAGLTADSLFASHMFSVDVPAGQALPVSMICGVGARTAGNWMQIRGSICNGFSNGDQFRYDVEPTIANDGPHAFTDEDWITHTGGWLSALSRQISH